LFNGKELDDKTGLYYYGARYYDPVLSNWLSVDPYLTDGTYSGSNPLELTNNGVFNSKNLSSYSYSWNSPVLLRDPDGKAITPETVWDVINVAMGVASFGANVASGNIIGAAIDIAGTIYDATAAAVPVLPAGASTAIGAYRLVKLVEKSKDLLTASSKILSKYKSPVSDGARRLEKSVNSISGKGTIDDLVGAIQEKLGIPLISPKPGGHPQGHVMKVEGTINSLKKSANEINKVLRSQKSNLTKQEKGILKQTRQNIEKLADKYEKILDVADNF